MTLYWLTSTVDAWGGLAYSGRDTLKKITPLISWPAPLRRLTVGRLTRPIPFERYPFGNPFFRLVESFV